MAIYLDDDAVDLTGADLGSVLESARKRVEPSGRMIVEVHVNGEAVVGDALERRLGAAVAGAEVRLYSAVPRELAVASLRQVQAYLYEARDAQREAAELLQKDKMADAMKKIGRSVEIWQHTQQAVLHSSLLMDIDLDARPFEGRPVAEVTNGLLAQIRQLRDLITAVDTVGLADALAYEWPETVDRWDRLINHLVEEIEKKS